MSKSDKSKARVNFREMAFCLVYAKTKDAALAFEHAGYKPRANRNATQQAASNLLKKPRVRAEIARIIKREANKYCATKPNVIREFARIGFTSIADFCDWSKAGVTMKSKAEMSEDQLAAVKEISETRWKTRDGRDSVKVQLKLHDKNKSLEALARHLGMFDDQLKVKLDEQTVELLLKLIRSLERNWQADCL
jgi:phage terminase small subunit